MFSRGRAKKNILYSRARTAPPAHQTCNKCCSRAVKNRGRGGKRNDRGTFFGHCFMALHITRSSSSSLDPPRFASPSPLSGDICIPAGPRAARRGQNQPAKLKCLLTHSNNVELIQKKAQSVKLTRAYSTK